MPEEIIPKLSRSRPSISVRVVYRSGRWHCLVDDDEDGGTRYAGEVVPGDYYSEGTVSGV